ncbi:hypothetical protein KP509_21G079600 [Ceratopteris richardii]|uniref:Uncharacterized protein n=1 Tax=Ceratopteris richardii TaxID=49495 RepID=A0A8T2SBQ9_CERRI|nr:hypothetical protein KP509_21G079600 [Ceratopteris richardii]
MHFHQLSTEQKGYKCYNQSHKGTCPRALGTPSPRKEEARRAKGTGDVPETPTVIAKCPRDGRRLQIGLGTAGRFWRVESPVSAGEGGGARPWSCKLCGYKRTGGANKVCAHLLHERGHEVRFCSAITSEKKQELLNKLAISDAQAHARRASQAPIDPASFVRSSMPSSSRASSSSVPVHAPTPTSTPTPTPTSTPHPTLSSSTPSGMPYVRQSRQQTLHENWNPVLKEEVDSAVARFFYHDHIAFNAARSPYFKDMVKKTGEYGAHYVPPSSESLRTTLLEKEKKLVEATCETIKKSWERNGVSLLVDGWMVPYSRGEMYFISSHDASDTGKPADVLASEWASAIEIVGQSNVVCIVADGEPSNRDAGAIIENLYPHIIVCFCMAHCLNNILKDIGNLDWISAVINEANSLVSFINNHARVQNEFSKRSTLALLKYSDTRFAYNFTMLHRVVKCSGVLRGLLLSDEFGRMPEASTSRGRQFRRLADDVAWWENISHIVDIVHPLVHLLKIVDSMEPCIGKVHEVMDRTIEALKTLVKDNDRYEEISAICVRRWDAYYSPLHAATYMLDPKFQDKKQYADLEVANGLRIILERFVQDSAARRLIRDQLSKYRTGKDASYACGDAQEDRLRVGATLWWEDFGFDGPKLQQLAIRILSQACTTSCLEQLWSVYGHVSSKKRNMLGVQRASDLVFVSANLRMLRRTQCMEGDLFREWEEVRVSRDVVFDELRPWYEDKGKEKILEEDCDDYEGTNQREVEQLSTKV